MFDVNDGTAVIADEVDVGFDCAVEPLHTVDTAETLDQALLFEEGEIPVNGPEGQVRDFGFQLGINDLSGRVLVRLAQKIENRVPFPELFSGLLHRHTLVSYWIVCKCE